MIGRVAARYCSKLCSSIRFTAFELTIFNFPPPIVDTTRSAFASPCLAVKLRGEPFKFSLFRYNHVALASCYIHSNIRPGLKSTSPCSRPHETSTPNTSIPIYSNRASCDNGPLCHRATNPTRRRTTARPWRRGILPQDRTRDPAYRWLQLQTRITKMGRGVPCGNLCKPIAGIAAEGEPQHSRITDLARFVRSSGRGYRGGQKRYTSCSKYLLLGVQVHVRVPLPHPVDWSLYDYVVDAGRETGPSKNIISCYFSTSISNPGDVQTWNKMAAIKSNILKRWDTAATGVRVCCIKFVQKVVQVQTQGVIADPRVRDLKDVILSKGKLTWLCSALTKTRSLLLLYQGTIL